MSLWAYEPGTVMRDDGTMYGVTYRKATFAELLAAVRELGYLVVRGGTCETCDGSGWHCRLAHDPCTGPPKSRHTYQKCDVCPDCVNGLVPSPEAIEAGAEANWYEWHKGHSGGFKGAMRAMARAGLLAAIDTEET